MRQRMAAPKTTGAWLPCHVRLLPHRVPERPIYLAQRVSSVRPAGERVQPSGEEVRRAGHDAVLAHGGEDSGGGETTLKVCHSRAEARRRAGSADAATGV